jgi:hypothetical protein
MMRQVSVILDSIIQESMERKELSARLATQNVIGLMSDKGEGYEFMELVEEACLRP